MLVDGDMTQTYSIADLSPVEKTYLGVLATGIVPARLAKDSSLRMDYLTAICLAIIEGLPHDTYLDGEGPEITPSFREQLTRGAVGLDEKGILAAGPPPPDMLMSADMARPKPPPVIDFDQHPRIFDRYLGAQCMEELFRNPEVYPFLMGKYQDSAEVWGRLHHEGYGRWR